MKETLFEDFIEYCKEDNKKLAKDIETWLADFFDLPNREIPLDKAEEDWINKNLSEENQIRILGYTAKQFNKRKLTEMKTKEYKCLNCGLRVKKIPKFKEKECPNNLQHYFKWKQ
jgi:ribosomal protein S26